MDVSELERRQHLRKILEGDRIWSAYALADLDPKEDDLCKWIVGEASVILLYLGFSPPILFAHGELQELNLLFDQVPAGTYIYTISSAIKELLNNRLAPKNEQYMWRMALEPDEFPRIVSSEVKPLGLKDHPAIETLFADHVDRPDAFHTRQLKDGPFFGIRRNGNLVCIAGIHVRSPWASVAAIGNVFTKPDQRGKGLATRSSAAVVGALLDSGIQTVVLNVSLDNEPAIRCYRRLGFWPRITYYEGIGDLGSLES